MAIKKLVDDKEKVFANKGITSHNELANREAYGCHPISAIRKLPEKLAALQASNATLNNSLQQLTARVGAVEIAQTSLVSGESALASLSEETTNEENLVLLSEAVDKINLVENEDKIIFTNAKGETTSIQNIYKVDNDSISLTSDNKLQVKKIYTEETLEGEGTVDSPLKIKVTVDNDSIKVIDNKMYVNSIKNEDGDDLTAELINNNISRIDEDIEDIIEVNNTQSTRIENLEATVNGTGGYLTSYNFNKTTPTQSTITNYALQDTELTTSTDLPNGVKVINLYDQHTWRLTNDGTTFIWKDLGEVKTISIATDETLGLIKGSTEDYRGSIDISGELSINGLEEKFTDIDSNLDTLNEDVDELKENVTTITNNVSDNTSNITALTNTLNTIYESSTNTLKSKDITLNGNSLADTLNSINSTITSKANSSDLDNYVTKTMVANETTLGLVKVSSDKGIKIEDGIISTLKATDTDIDNKTDSYKPIVASNLDYAVKHSLVSNKQILSSEEKELIKTWIGVTDKYLHNIQVNTTTDTATYNYSFSILNTTKTAYTKIEDIITYLNSFNSYNNLIFANGIYIEDDISYIVLGITLNENNDLVLSLYNTETKEFSSVTSELVTITDFIQ